MAQVRITLTPASDHRLVRTAASYVGQTLAEFCAQAAICRARDVVQSLADATPPTAKKDA